MSRADLAISESIGTGQSAPLEPMSSRLGDLEGAGSSYLMIELTKALGLYTRWDVWVHSPRPLRRDRDRERKQDTMARTGMNATRIWTGAVNTRHDMERRALETTIVPPCVIHSDGSAIQHRLAWMMVVVVPNRWSGSKGSFPASVDPASTNRRVCTGTSGRPSNGNSDPSPEYER